MKHTSIGVVASLASAAALAQSVGFDSDAVGSVRPRRSPVRLPPGTSMPCSRTTNGRRRALGWPLPMQHERRPSEGRDVAARKRCVQP